MDIKYDSGVHLDQLENFTIEVLQAMEESGIECLPRTYVGGSRKKKGTPGWNDYVKPFSEEARFWHSL